jgi:hypothetical protein
LTHDLEGFEDKVHHGGPSKQAQKEPKGVLELVDFAGMFAVFDVIPYRECQVFFAHLRERI